MLDLLYEHYGFWLSLFILWGILVSIIFWLAGIAGIMLLPQSKTNSIKLIVGVVFPPFTVVWMIFDMFQQRRALKSDTN